MGAICAFRHVLSRKYGGAPGSSEVIEVVTARNDKATPTDTTHCDYQTLRQQTITSVIAPWSRHNVYALKSTLDSGTSPTREVLSALAPDQLLERIDQRGFRTSLAQRNSAPENQLETNWLLTAPEL